MLIHDICQILQEEKTSECLLIDGEFLSPMELFLPGVVPPESRRSHFQLVLPLKWKNEKYKPICVHFAGTGDHVSEINTFIIVHGFLIDIKTNNVFSSFGEDEISWPNHCYVKEASVLFYWKIHFMA